MSVVRRVILSQRIRSWPEFQVIKPGRVGGFEKSWQMAQLAQKLGMMVVISSAFESSISLAAFSQFAAHVDRSARAVAAVATDSSVEKTKKKMPALVAHGLGTYKWLQDRTALHVRPTSSSMEISIQESASYFEQMCRNSGAFWANSGRNYFQSYNVNVYLRLGAFRFHVTESSIVAPRVCLTLVYHDYSVSTNG
jgi:isochorismate synthase/2-succinyl-5-enolpyruvyl-6-hydroxy-3-cyclohexene-1-carboxylate synthase/2-succinyl-6-hydroxy-2,4-cyclohexadiene-1-carboxylate synthase/O-succinylbenzoate synthase